MLINVRGVPLLRRWCITGKSGLSRVLTEMGLNIRIEASHHPSSSLLHPDDRLKDLSPKWWKRGFTLRLWVPSSQTLDWKVNLILIGVFCWHSVVKVTFLIMQGFSLCLIPRSLVQNLQPHLHWPHCSVKGEGDFQPLAPPLPASCKISSCWSPAPDSSFYKCAGLAPLIDSDAFERHYNFIDS